jgi:hypothetical protein
MADTRRKQHAQEPSPIPLHPAMAQARGSEVPVTSAGVVYEAVTT